MQQIKMCIVLEGHGENRPFHSQLFADEIEVYTTTIEAFIKYKVIFTNLYGSCVRVKMWNEFGEQSVQSVYWICTCENGYKWHWQNHFCQSLDTTYVYMTKPASGCRNYDGSKGVR